MTAGLCAGRRTRQKPGGNGSAFGVPPCAWQRGPTMQVCDGGRGPLGSKEPGHRGLAHCTAGLS